MEMKMRVHELHPSLIHAPLAFLPAAAVIDLVAYGSKDRAWARFGQRMWVTATASAAIAGIAGLAASQEIKARSPQARDTLFIHGLGNTLLLGSALGITIWRSTHRPSLGQCALALVACGTALYTAWLGGELVYSQGVGVKSMPGVSDQGVTLSESPPLFSRRAPGVLLRDALRGLGWLVERARLALNGQVPVQPEATGIPRLEKRAEAEPAYSPAHGQSQMPIPPA